MTKNNNEFLISLAWALAALAVVHASPAAHLHRSPSPLSVTPPKDQEFSLAMTVNGANVSLTATYNGTDDIVLQAGPLSVYPGTPTYTNESATVSTSGYNTSLVFDLTADNTASATLLPAGLYGLSVPDLGELYGSSANVFAVKDYQEFNFDVVDGQVYHQLTAAPQNWFACNDTVDGQWNYFLKWGVYSEDLTPPAGCLYTKLIQNFNVPGGASSRS